MIAPVDPDRENRIEACKTYVEQTKQLLTLASAFLIVPAGLMALLTDKGVSLLPARIKCLFLLSEVCFVGSVLAGYVVLATIAGSQAKGLFDVYRGATRLSSFAQLGGYIGGLAVFVWLLAVAFRS